MSKLYVDEDRYGEAPPSLLVETVRNAVTHLVRQRFAASAVNWSAFVFEASDRLITSQDFADIERQILDTGYRFGWSAVISQRERPDIYGAADDVGADLANFSFEHPEASSAQQPDSDGRTQCGFGENVVRRKANAVGVARYVRSSDRVIEYMQNGVPDGTIAIIDDSGGTLTAPILEHFAGIVCAGGTVRSHLGILAREYGIPCLMNARIRGIHDGDRVEIETSAEAMAAEAYFGGEAKLARVWKIVR
jgi:phosphohistidine swiveling domain-containing protein